MKKLKDFELLAPAGDFPSLIAAINAGADAVYFGLKEFNMRDSAKNFKISDLNKITSICGKKVKKYLTLNTIIYDNELKLIEQIIKKLKNKVDAVICWDLSVVKLCRKYKIPIHISTQASVANSESAKFYKSLGARRIILARELNLRQIKKISKVIPIECFVHGAMCVSVSGRCFTSQFLQNKSANRGQCTHPCRRFYSIRDQDGYELKLENNRVMSAKDLCCLPFIEKLKQAGIISFKIEGRGRNPEYVYAVTKIYRKALDNKLSQKELNESMEQLKKIYNRGFSSGFYIKLPTSDDFSRSEHGESTERKEFIGKIDKYWPNISVAAFKLNSGKLKIGDEVYIIGDKTGIKRTRISSMEINNNPIKQANKSQIIGIKLPECRKGDDVYLIKKKQ
ncbi:protease [Candidatus Woesearchaeota archaeon CG10_big_fil_rev_8_21_14_0_10_34_12]|nr:MAG: protease [Candidatus Woesearchaeota archaeon CG10_big_fil_rev_8_21_14_0_10_34_12]